MIISYLSHHKVEVKKGKITYVGTGNRQVYLDFVQGFKDSNEKIKLFTDEYDKLTVRKEIDWLGSLIDYETIPSKITKKVITTITDNLTNEEINQMQQIHRQMTKLIQQKLFMTDLPLVVNFDYTNAKLFKYAEVKFDSTIFLNPLELLLTYIKIHAECRDERIVTIINPSHFLTVEDMIVVERLCQETQVSLLMIDYLHQVDFMNYSHCLKYYIDEDFIDYF